MRGTARGQGDMGRLYTKSLHADRDRTHHPRIYGLDSGPTCTMPPVTVRTGTLTGSDRRQNPFEAEFKLPVGIVLPVTR